MATLAEIEQRLAEFDGRPCKKCGKLVYWDTWSLHRKMCRECDRRMVESGEEDSEANDPW